MTHTEWVEWISDYCQMVDFRFEDDSFYYIPNSLCYYHLLVFLIVYICTNIVITVSNLWVYKV